MTDGAAINDRRWWPWALVAAGAVAWTAGLLFWVNATSAYRLRQHVMYVSPAFLWAGAIALVVALWLNGPDLWRWLASRLDRRQSAILAALALGAIVLSAFVSPRAHRIFFDEDIYEVIALDMAQNNRAAMANAGLWEFGRFKNHMPEPNKQPNAWPFVLQIAYRLFGVSELVGYRVASAAYALFVVLVFFLGRELFQSPRAGWLAGALCLLVPENARWYSSLSAEGPAACAVAFALLMTLFYLRRGSAQSTFLMVASWAFAVQFRYEIGLLAGLVFAMIYVERWRDLSTARFYGFVLLFLLLIFGHAFQLLVFRGDSWGSSGDKMGLHYFGKNLLENTRYYADPVRFPVLVTVFAVAGLFWRGLRISRIYLAIWFFLSWAVYLFFYAGSYTYGVDVRYALMSIAPFVLLAGYGADRFLAWASTAWGTRWARMALSAAFGLSLLGYLPRIRSLGQEAWQCREDHRAAERFAAKIPEDSIVLTHNPNMFQLLGKNAGQMSLAVTNRPYYDQVIQPLYRDHVYVHWNYWCNTTDPVQSRFCSDVLRRFETELVDEVKIRDQRFALYRIIKDAPAIPGS